jgi:crossover junction endodeoxyribonuclease RuvC
MRVLGIDTSLRSTGVAVVESRGTALAAVEYDTLRIPAAASLSECLRRLADGIGETIGRTAPDAVAIEGVFYCKNVKTAILLGEARGAVIAACAARAVPVYEYEPRRIKQALVGFGGAEKAQVRMMAMRLLGLDVEPQEDAGDALALAICHLHGSTVHEVLRRKPI